MESKDQVVQLLVEKYGVAEEKVTLDATMTELGLDSLSVAEMLFDIEDLFAIRIDTEQAEFRTLGEAVALVDRHLQARGT